MLEIISLRLLVPILEPMNKREIEARLVRFRVAIIELSNKFSANMAGVHFKNQIIRSGTAPRIELAEAMEAESIKDFVHKIKIVLKELRETNVALNIFRDVHLCKDLKHLEDDLRECNELIAIFIASVKTTRKKL